ncbi:MAG: hypothetical protein K6B45_06020 [Bacteroidaceae bacterium]|nr:hypothetical protein [Bacteroidaceae bacterium]
MTKFAKINGEERILAIVQPLFQKAKATKAAKAESDKLGMEGPAEVKQGIVRPIRLEKMYSTCDPKVAWEAGITLVDRMGNKIEEGTAGVLLFIPTDDTLDAFYSVTEMKFVQDYTTEVADFKTWCRTVVEYMPKRMTKEMKFFLITVITGDPAMQSVMQFKDATGLSLETSKKYIGWKAPQRRRTDKEGAIHLATVPGWERKLVDGVEDMARPRVDAQRATPEVREYVASLIRDGVFTLRQLSKEGVMKNVLKDYFEGLQAGQKGGEAVGGEPDTDGGQP